jgi:hypothetical protein
MKFGLKVPSSVSIVKRFFRFKKTPQKKGHFFESSQSLKKTYLRHPLQDFFAVFFLACFFVAFFFAAFFFGIFMRLRNVISLSVFMKSMQPYFIDV